MAVSFKVVSYPGSFIMDGKTQVELEMAYSRLYPYIVIRFYNPSTERYQDYFFESSQVSNRTLTFLPDDTLIHLAGISASDTYKTIRMAVWMADTDRQRVSEYEFVSVRVRMPAPVLNPGWISLEPFKRQPDLKPTDRFIKGYFMRATLNADYIDLPPNTEITGMSGAADDTHFAYSLMPNPSNPGGTFDGRLFAQLNTAGDMEVTFSVQDSRGQTASETFTVHVYEYFSPAISCVSVFRCNADGAANEDGHYLSVKADIRYSHMDGAITLTHSYVEFRETASETPEREDIESGNAIVVGGGNITAAQSYYLKIFVQDSTLASAQYETVLSSAKAAFNIMEGGHGAAFGRLASRANVLDSAWDIGSDGGIHAGVEQQNDGTYISKAYMDKDGNIHASGNVTGANIRGIEETLDRVYPVGSVYISVSETDPGIMFGGVWARLKDTFLLAAGDAYPAGASGGEAEHMLTIDEMPRHTHDFKTKTKAVASGSSFSRMASDGSDTGDLIIETGGGLAHNNMPPYIAVYMWQRTE